MAPVGLRVRSSIDRPDPRLVERFAALAIPDISDAMHHSGTMDRGIGPVYLPIKRALGPAVTVSVPIGAQSIRKVGMQQTRAGDVLVLNALGNRTQAMLGGNLAQSLLHRGVAGVIVDGAVRDLSEIREMGLPIFCRGVATLPGAKDGPGEVNVPIACGGVVVRPGDIVVADEDGIVVIAPETAEDVLAGVAKLEADHAATWDALQRGEVTSYTEIEEKLRAQGVEFRED